jgi:hypothetical protein
MQSNQPNDTRIRARNAATRMLNTVTTGVVFAAVAGVGLFGAMSAFTIPGVATYSTGATASTSTSTGSTSGGLQSPSTTVGSSSSSGVAVSGGS